MQKKVLHGTQDSLVACHIAQYGQLCDIVDAITVTKRLPTGKQCMLIEVRPRMYQEPGRGGWNAERHVAAHAVPSSSSGGSVPCRLP